MHNDPQMMHAMIKAHQSELRRQHAAQRLADEIAGPRANPFRGLVAAFNRGLRAAAPRQPISPNEVRPRSIPRRKRAW